MVKLVLLLAFSACAWSGPLVITSGRFDLSPFDVFWAFGGNGFSALGHDDHFTDQCGFCMAPFQLVNPVFRSVNAANGQITLGAKGYILPNPVSFGLYPGGPWANGSVFLSPQAGLPTVTAAGTYDVPFNVGGSFCVTDNPDFRAPQTVVFPSQELLLLTIR